MALALDDGIGHVIASLRKNGLEENTLFIFISDNGSPRGQGIECSTGYEYKDRGNTTMSSPGPFRGYKADTYEGGLRVPCIMSWPSELPQGRVYDNPVISLDIFPTVMQPVSRNFRYKEGYRRKVSGHNRRIYDAKYRRSVIAENFKLPYKGK